MADLSFVQRAVERLERSLLRRQVAKPLMRATRLDLRLDMSTVSDQIRVQADLRFRPQVTAPRMVCLIGNVTVHSATWNDRPIKARVNAPYVVLDFPKRLESMKEVAVQLKYTYRPDEHFTVQQPMTLDEYPERIWITCRRPLLGLVQGKLAAPGVEKPPLVTYQWEPPRNRRLNALVASVKSFRKETSSGMSMWLHLQPESADRAPRILDLCIQVCEESADSHHRQLPYSDYHVVECDDMRIRPFNSPGMIVVPKGTFRVDDRPAIYGVLAPELNKEWNRDALRMVAEGKSD